MFYKEDDDLCLYSGTEEATFWLVWQQYASQLFFLGGGVNVTH